MNGGVLDLRIGPNFRRYKKGRKSLELKSDFNYREHTVPVRPKGGRIVLMPGEIILSPLGIAPPFRA